MEEALHNQSIAMVMVMTMRVFCDGHCLPALLVHLISSLPTLGLFTVGRVLILLLCFSLTAKEKRTFSQLQGINHTCFKSVMVISLGMGRVCSSVLVYRTQGSSSEEFLGNFSFSLIKIAA